MLEDGLKKLNDWEAAVEKETEKTKDTKGKKRAKEPKEVKEAKGIPRKKFLTQPTAEGLRMTLSSMLEFIPYMRKQFQSPPILTGKINQDSLEVRLKSKFFRVMNSETTILIYCFF